MSSIVKKYKLALELIVVLFLLPLVPVVAEILFKCGNYLGTWVRYIGIC